MNCVSKGKKKKCDQSYIVWIAVTLMEYIDVQ